LYASKASGPSAPVFSYYKHAKGVPVLVSAGCTYVILKKYIQ